MLTLNLTSYFYRAPSFDGRRLRYARSRLLRSQGTPLKVPQAQLGHPQLATTLKIYTEASESARHELVNLLDEQLFPNVPKLKGSQETKEDESRLVL